MRTCTAAPHPPAATAAGWRSGGGTAHTVQQAGVELQWRRRGHVARGAHICFANVMSGHIAGGKVVSGGPAGLPEPGSPSKELSSPKPTAGQEQARAAVECAHSLPAGHADGASLAGVWPMAGCSNALSSSRVPECSLPANSMLGSPNRRAASCICWIMK